MKEKSIIALLGLALGVPAAGQVVKNDSIEGFNAIDFLMQTRYQFPDKPFQKQSWLDNTYLQVGAGLFNPNQRGQLQVRDMQEIHFNVGKNLTPVHGVRVGLSYGTGHERETGTELQSSLAHADYLFNVSSYIGGYNPDRFFEVSTILGLGYQQTNLLGQKKGSLEGHFGAELRIKAGEQAYISLEPMVQINNGRVQDNWRYVGMGTGVTLNYQYYLRPLTPDGGGSSRYTHISPYFVEYGLGYQLHNLMKTGFWRSRGASYQINMGKWFSPALGARAGVGVSSNTYDRQVSDADSRAQFYDMGYAEGHMEALVNPLGFVKSNALDARAGFHVFGGVTFGGADIFDREQTYHFSGYTAGLQAWYKLQPGLQLYVEPRLSYIRGNFDADATAHFSDNYEKLLSLNVGLRMNAYTWDQRKDRYERNQDLFRKKFFVQLAGGIANENLHQMGYEGNDVPDVSGRLSLGYRFTPLHAVRVNGDFSMLIDRSFNYYQRSQTIGGVSLDYLFGLTHALQEGYDKDRKLSAEPYLGGIYDVMNRTWGGHLGLQLNRRVNAHTSLFLAPEVQVLKRVDAEDKDNILNSGWNPLMAVYAGVQYEFTGMKDGLKGLFPAERNQRAGYESPFFVETGMGLSLPSVSITPSDWHVAPAYRIGVGHWINPAVAFRFSLMHQNLNLSGTHLTHQYQGILDVLYNPFNMGKSVQYDAKSIGMNLIGGVGYALTEPQHGVSNTGYSLNAGIQGWWRLMPGTRLFVEPRYQRMVYSLVKPYAPLNIWSVQAGLQYDWTLKNKRLSRSEQKSQFLDQGIFTEYELGTVTPLLHVGDINSDHNWNTHYGLAVGYLMNPLSGFRFGFENQSHFQQSGESRTYVRNLNLSLGYLLNIGTLLQGYRPDVRVSTQLLVAPMAQYQTTGKYFNLGGQVGLQMSYRLNDRLSAYVRSSYHVLRDTHLERSLQRNVVYAAGLSYRMKDRSDAQDKMNWFVDGSSGLQSFSKDIQMDRLGAENQVAVGTWISKVFGLRFALAKGTLYRQPDEEIRFGDYGNLELRSELMVDPLSWLSDYHRESAAAGLYAYVGPKWGKISAHNGDSEHTSYLSGYIVGVQPWVRISPYHRLFVEGSLSNNRYYDMQAEDGRSAYSAAVLSLGLSLDIQRGARRTFTKEELDRRFFVDAMGGFGCSSDHSGVNVISSYLLGGGYLFDHFSAVKVQAGYRPPYEDKSSEVEASVAYQLNLTNALTGYQSGRKFHVDVYAGFSLLSPKKSSLKLGDFVGMQANYAINNQLYVHLGPDLMLHPYRFRLLAGVGYRF